jgi:ornithine decarboxylase
MGVSMMTFDNIDELYKIAKSFPAAKLVIRIHTDDSKALCRLGLKFGASLVAVPALLAKAKELELDVVGVSFHVGSGCFDSSAFADAVRRARTAFDMGKDAGYCFSMLDVGGGFEDSTFESTASVLSAAIKTHFPDRKETGLRIIAEPGRYFVSKAFSLAVNIIARRTPTSAEDAKEVFEDSTSPNVRCAFFFFCMRIITNHSFVRCLVYINDGVYGAFSCILFDHQKVQPYVLSLNGSFHVSSLEPLGVCSVWGPTCDSIDCVCPVTQLPNALRVGDWLGFDNMGAYSICAASHFNGFEVSNVTYTTGGECGANKVKSVLKRFAEGA